MAVELKCTGCAESNCDKFDCQCRCHEIMKNLQRAKDETVEQLLGFDNEKEKEESE